MSTVNRQEQEKNVTLIQIESIKHLLHIVNTIKKPVINDCISSFFINSELEKILFINKKIAEGINEEKADSVFDWVVMQNGGVNESLVLNKLKNYLSPLCDFSIDRIYESGDSYTMFEVSITLTNKGKKKVIYYFQIGKLAEEKYPIIDIYDSAFTSIITGRPKGC